MKVLKQKTTDSGVKQLKVQDLRNLEEDQFQLNGTVFNNKKNVIQDLGKGTLFVRDNKDPQQFGKIWITESEYNHLRQKTCIFCNQLDCLYFYFRESFYKMIQYWIANSESFVNTRKIKNAWSFIENQDDIFMPAKNTSNVNFNLIEIIQKNAHYQINDWFSFNFMDQLRHESKVRDFVLENNTQSIILNSQEYRLSKDSFKIDLDPKEIGKPCNVCHKKISCGFMSYISLLKVAQQIRLQFSLPNFTDDSQLLVAKNWSQLNQGKDKSLRYVFTYGKVRANLKDDLMFGHKNFLTCFIEHVKAFQGPFKQLINNPLAKKFCNSYMCTNLADKFCSRCKQVWYCSADHQKSDWQTHKSTCQSLQIPRQEKDLSQQVTNNQIFDKNSEKTQQESKDENIVNSTNFSESVQQTKQQQKNLEIAESTFSKVIDKNQILAQEASQSIEKRIYEEIEYCKGQRDLLLKLQKQNIPKPNPLEKAEINHSADIATEEKNQNESIKSNLQRKEEEEIKEPQDETSKNKQNQTKSIQATTQVNQDQINDLEDRVEQLEKSKFDLQRENLKLNEKIIQLEQQQFELKQQVKQLILKLA